LTEIAENLPLEFTLDSPGGSAIELVSSIQPAYNGLILPESKIICAKTDMGEMVFQHFPGDGFDVWLSRYDIPDGAIIKGRADIPVIELAITLENHFVSSWDGIGQPLTKSMECSLVYSPFVLNKAWLMPSVRYTTFDFHFSFEVLACYAPAFPALARFLEKVLRHEPCNLGGPRPISGRMQMLLKEILSMEFKAAAYSRQIKARTEILLVLALELLTKSKAKTTYLTTEASRDKAYAAKLILDSRKKNPPTIEELSRLVLGNQSSLQRAFQECFGISIAAYWDSNRLELIKDLLRNKSLDLNSIADEVGYNDAAALSRFFKKMEDISPGEWRKHNS